jgi:hypothetical protein
MDRQCQVSLPGRCRAHYEYGYRQVCRFARLDNQIVHYLRDRNKKAI